MKSQKPKKEDQFMSSGNNVKEDKNTFAKQINLKANKVYQNLMPVVPSRNHWFVYSITVLVSLFLFVITSVLLVLSSNFFPHAIGFYVLIAAVSCVLGAVTGIILDKLVMEEKLIFYGSLMISILGTLCILVLILMLGELNSQTEAFSESPGMEGAGIINMFGAPPNALITAILMICLFNLFPYIIMRKRKNKSSNVNKI